MCGICGELRFDGSRPDKTRLRKMTGKLARRGPDASGEYFSGPLAFGHRRLAVIDLSERSSQPMVDAALGLVLVFNGTIYNYPELREQLRRKGYRFFSEGDSEAGRVCLRDLERQYTAAFPGARPLWRQTVLLQPRSPRCAFCLDQPGTAGRRGTGYRHRSTSRFQAPVVKRRFSQRTCSKVSPCCAAA